jgi:LysR family transcriptional regulator, hydrogen peroxide-inducible genes activator
LKFAARLPTLFAMPSLRQLQYFVAVSETRNFRAAAEKVGVSQPTLSAQLLALERRLGVPLIERNRQPALLTAAGARILPLAQQAVATLRDIQEAARGLKGGAADRLRLGLPTTIGPYLLPKLVPALHARFPGLRLAVREDYPLALPDALLSGAHDLLILPLPVRNAELAQERLFREPLYLAVPSDHALAKAKEIELAALAGQPVLTLEKGHALHEQVQAICQDCGARMLHDFEGTSLDTLQQMVATGAGFAFLPGLFAHGSSENLAGIALLRLKGKPLHRTLGLAWRASSRDAAMFRTFGELVRASVRRHYPSFQVHDA